MKNETPNTKTKLVPKLTPALKAWLREVQEEVGGLLSERERKKKSRMGVDYSACRAAEKEFLAGRFDPTLAEPIFIAFVQHGFSNARFRRCTKKGVFDPRVAELRGHK